jgi:hypothetical protein
MELKGISLLTMFFISLFLIVLGLLVYLHIKHKMDWKLVFILPVLIIIGSFFIINLNKFTITKFKFSEVEVEIAKKEIDDKLKDGLEKALEKIQNEATEQRKSLESLISKTNEIALRRNEIADEANAKAQSATNIAQHALEQSGSFSSINAEAHWYTLREQYEDSDSIIKEWEQSRSLKRDSSNKNIPENIKVLDQNITNLDEKLLKRDKEGMPSHIKEIYRKRFRQYDSLKNVSERYKPFAERFSSIDFTLPSPPTIPSGFTISGGSFSGVSIGGGR